MHLLNKYTIPFLSSEWFLVNGITFFLIIISLFFLINMSKTNIGKFNKYFAYILIFEYVIMQAFYVINESWSLIESMPFHLCTFMWFNTIYILFTKKQWAFELMLFIGLPVGGIKEKILAAKRALKYRPSSVKRRRAYFSFRYIWF